MNKESFDGFNNIKASEDLINRTKKKMREYDGKEKVNSPKKVLFTVMSVATVLIVLSVICFYYTYLGQNKIILTAHAQDLMKGITTQKVDVGNAVTDDFRRSTQNFSIELFKNSVEDGENTLVSPTSAYLSLGMASNGASGKTLSEFKNTLGKYDLTLDDLNKAYKAYSDDLIAKRGNTAITISNSIWLRNDFKADSSFLQTNADYFGSGANTINFNDKDATEAINNWVKNQTNNKIDKIVDQADPKTVMMLLNAISFDAKWKMPFDTETKALQGNFYLENGTKQSVNFMLLYEHVDYIKTQNETAVLLPYDDDRFTFLCILPNQGTKLSDYIKTLNEDSISNLISLKKNTYIPVALPEFKISVDFDLDDSLSKIGLGTAFDEEKSGFSNMGKETGGLYISSIKQKEFLQVNEIGTSAGSVAKTSYLQQIINDNGIEFNRPFLYTIVDTKTNLPLFMGTLANPLEQ